MKTGLLRLLICPLTNPFSRYGKYNPVDNSIEVVSYISNNNGQRDAGLEDSKKKVIAYTLQP